VPPKKRGQRPPPRKSGSPRSGSARAGSPRAGSPRAGSATTAGRGRQAAATRSFYTPGGSPFRHGVERRSAPVLVLLTQAPRLVIMLAPLALFLLGVFLPLIPGLVVLGAFCLLTGWLAYLSWPGADARAKLIRIVMFAIVIAIVIFRIVRA
jgi:hypothetical protein